MPGRVAMGPNLGRRDFLTAAAGAGVTLCGWLGRLAAGAHEGPGPKSGILLWMAGGPSHIDTFDPKPDAPANVRGEFRPIDTSVPGIRISEHFPRFARLMQHAAILRGMSTVESDHKQATYHLHTGYQNRAGAVAFPSLGAIVAKEMGKRDVALHNSVCIGGPPQEGVGAGFLGPAGQPLAVTDPSRGLDFIEPAGPREAFRRKIALWRQFEEGVSQQSSGPDVAHRTAIDRAVQLMNSEQ